MLGILLETCRLFTYFGRLMGILNIGLLLMLVSSSLASSGTSQLSESSNISGASEEDGVRLFDLKWALEQRLALEDSLPLKSGAQTGVSDYTALGVAEEACWSFNKTNRRVCLGELHRFYWLITAQNRELTKKTSRDETWQVKPIFGEKVIQSVSSVEILEQQTFYPSLLEGMRSEHSWRNSFEKLRMRKVFTSRPDVQETPRRSALRAFDSEMIDRLVSYYQNELSKRDQSSSSTTPVEYSESSDEYNKEISNSYGSRSKDKSILKRNQKRTLEHEKSKQKKNSANGEITTFSTRGTYSKKETDLAKRNNYRNPAISRRLFGPEDIIQRPLKEQEELQDCLPRVESNTVSCWWKYQSKFLTFLETIYELAMKYWVKDEPEVWQTNFVFWYERVLMLWDTLTYCADKSGVTSFFDPTDMVQRRNMLDTFMLNYKKEVSTQVSYKNPEQLFIMAFQVAILKEAPLFSSLLNPLCGDNVDAWNKAYDESVLAKLRQKFDVVSVTMVLMYMASPKLIPKGKKHLSPAACLKDLREAIISQDEEAYRKALNSVEELGKMSQTHYSITLASWIRLSAQQDQEDRIQETGTESEKIDSEENSLDPYYDGDHRLTVLGSSIF